MCADSSRGLGKAIMVAAINGHTYQARTILNIVFLRLLTVFKTDY